MKIACLFLSSFSLSSAVVVNEHGGNLILNNGLIVNIFGGFFNTLNMDMYAGVDVLVVLEEVSLLALLLLFDR